MLYQVVKVTNGEEELISQGDGHEPNFQIYRECWAQTLLNDYDSPEDCNEVRAMQTVSEIEEFLYNILEDDPKGEEYPVIYFRSSITNS